MATLLETYKNRIAVAESMYSKMHEGDKLDSNRKLTLATVLNNTTKFLNEAFDASSGTQRSDMGLY